MSFNAFQQKSDDSGDGAPIYLAGHSDLRETGRAIGISLLGVDPAGPALFLPETGTEYRDGWNRWLKESFEGWMGECFVEIYLAAGEMRNRRVAKLDRRIDSRLSEDERARSLAAAAPFFEGTGEIRRLPQWSRFREKIDSGETPGHVTSLFALRSAVFHLPLLPALVSWLYFEWRSGLGAVPEYPGDRLTHLVFQSEFPEGVESARRIFNAHSGLNRLESL